MAPSKLAKQLTRTPGQLWDRLLVDTDSKQRRIEELRQQMEEMEMGECTFKPQINPRTRVLVQERLEALKQHNIKYHDQLFKDAERRRQRQAEYSHWYPEEITFQPKLYKRARLNNEDEEREQEPVFERMYKLAPKLMEKKRAMRDAILNGVDPETGQPFFKPVTGRAPTFQRNTSALPIGEFLYGMRYDFDERKGFKAERARLLTDSLANKPYAGTKSQALLEKMKERRFQQIFEYLDKDQDGAVALDSADLDMLDPEHTRSSRNSAILPFISQFL
ncbi:hypothetical protein CBR_g18903 [Chara braunii]|uniref:EF-hand domain-containing protein n=1 Tax=Chara braunii TaxID=69332 RepID=A0A388KX09_CHABU|nr:hypothetical protein CBR_g18903 [Chara braunii]|eukprot:GBG74493.1 hypothetical protein CBR_g18903 [Chara braunii]